MTCTLNTVQKSALPKSTIYSAIGKDPEAGHKSDQNYAVASTQGTNKLGFFSLEKKANEGKIQQKL